MKRIKAACIEQILQFQLKEDLEHGVAVRAVQSEYEAYKYRLGRSKIQYKILEETTLPDGTIQIRIRKQYNSAPVGELLN